MIANSLTFMDPYIRAMFGQNAIHIPFNAIVQPMGDQAIVAVIAIRGPEAMRLCFGSKATHQLILGDAVVRPHAVVESEHLVGSGLSGIARSGFDMEEWASRGRVILDANGRLAKGTVS